MSVLSSLGGDVPVVGSADTWTRRHAEAIIGTYGVPQRVLVRGEGCYVWDADGNRYLDLLAGIAVNSLGHAHPFLTAAITAQLATLGHTSNFFATLPQITLAERLLELAEAPSGSKVFFANSGAEANEAAVKASRRLADPGRRTDIIAAVGGFHGRTMGALALTHKAAYREPFEPLPPGVRHVPYGDSAALAAALDEEVAAVMLEPVQGEAGVRTPPAGYLAEVSRVTRAKGALLILDEVQTGVGRTGSWFAHRNPLVTGPVAKPTALDDVHPDLVTVAKGLGGGFPIGALIAYGDAAELLGVGQHGTTFGGNPVAAAAGLATLHVIERDDLLSNAAGVGAMIRDGVEGLGHPLVAGVRGVGLLLAVQLAQPVASQVAATLLQHGFIVNPVAPDAIRLAPPLILTTEQAATFVDALPAALDAAAISSAGEDNV